MAVTRAVIAFCWHTRACARKPVRQRETDRWIHVLDGTLIRSDSSITGSYTCDKIGTRSLGYARWSKVVKMEFEWHPGDSLSLYLPFDINFCLWHRYSNVSAAFAASWNFGTWNYRFMELEIYQLADRSRDEIERARLNDFI